MKASAILLWCVVTAIIAGYGGASRLPLPTADHGFPSGMGKPVATVLNAASKDSHCLLILLTDGAISHITIYKELGHLQISWGIGVFEAETSGQEANETQVQLSRMVGEARRLRQLSWCVTVVVVSDDPAFLAAFAQWSLKGRLLVWSTRLLAVTRLPTQQLRALLTSHWTFSMMNTMMMNEEHRNFTSGYGVYTHLPYSTRGPRVVQVALWTTLQGLILTAFLPPFPEKFSNFHSSTVNVTALPYPPYWMTSGEGNTTKYSGTDYSQLLTLARALNFTIHVLPSADWGEVTDQVQARWSFMASVIYVVLPSRLEKYDYTYTFDYSPLSFVMAKPTLKPQWQSLYYPLANEVWAAILATAFLECMALLVLTRAGVWSEEGSKMAAGAVVQEVVGTLLGQGFTGRLSTSRSNRVLVAAWLVFAFILGTAYRGNLTASLTLPKYPPRPETVEELVNTVDRVSMDSYGGTYRRFFRESGSGAFHSLGNLMRVGVDSIKGLQEALKKNQAHMDSLQYLELILAHNFTHIDGSSQFYIGRERILPSKSAWPVPHDAPYKTTFDRCLMAITEAGLYTKWMKDLLNEAQRESRARLRENVRQEMATSTEESEPGSSSSSIKALTIIHMQGPLMLLLLGLIIGGEILAVELLLVRFSTPRAVVQ